MFYALSYRYVGIDPQLGSTRYSTDMFGNFVRPPGPEQCQRRDQTGCVRSAAETTRNDMAIWAIFRCPQPSAYELDVRRNSIFTRRGLLG